MSRPSIRIVPLVGRSSPAINRKSVVLPEPEGPRTTTRSPSRMVQSRLSRAAVPEVNDLET